MILIVIILLQSKVDNETLLECFRSLDALIPLNYVQPWQEPFVEVFLLTRQRCAVKVQTRFAVL